MVPDPQPSGGFEWVQAASAPALVCRPLATMAPHLYTTRTWKLGSRSAEPDLAWAEVAQAAGVTAARLVRLRQVHGAAAIVVTTVESIDPIDLPQADIVGTDLPDVAVAVQAADCAPILLADPSAGVVAAAHAGWRGLAARAPAAAVAMFVDRWKSRPGDLVAAIGPSIGACCYEVGADVREAFEAAGFEPTSVARWFGAEHRPRYWHFDGWASAREQLMGAGMSAERIHVARLCTGCHPAHFSSYRREGGAAGRMAAVIRAPGRRAAGAAELER